MNARQAGTFVVDGLLEGTAGPGIEEKLTQWIRLARRAGYRFSLEVEAGTFSLLGENVPVPVDPPDSEITEPLRDLLQQLLEAMPENEQASLFSTVRSVEYGDGVETQTLYVIGPERTFEARQRVVDAVTAPAQRALTKSEKIRLGVISFLVLAALFLISSVFIDYRELFTKTWRKVAPVDTEAIELAAGPYEPYIKLSHLDTARGGRVLKVQLAPAAAFPKSMEAVEAELAKPGLSLVQRKVLESLASGYVRIELHGEDGWQSTTVVRVAGLRSEDAIDAEIPFKREEPPTRLLLAW